MFFHIAFNSFSPVRFLHERMREVADFDAPLAGVREVAFFPPMTGG